MKVEDLRIPVTRTWFFDLKEGDVFIYDTGYYMKITKDSYFGFQHSIFIKDAGNFSTQKVQATLVIKS